MTGLRFAWQREIVSRTPGLVLNVGCNEDPAGLKDVRPDDVINVDIEAVDSALNRPNRVDVLLDVTRDTWPWDDDEAELVVLGDIVEHLLPAEAKSMLREAKRVGKMIAITVPEDAREEILTQQAPESNPYAFHRTIVTEDYLRELLRITGWHPVEWHTVNYEFVPRGYFVLAEREERDA